ncbi:MAG: helix-turn-helix domain-containing protein [Egibacteraceae bacterium]
MGGRGEGETAVRRLCCPEHGVVVEGAPFARRGSRFVADLEDLVAWLTAKTDKTAVARLCRIAWPTVTYIVARVTADEIDPRRLDDLYELGVDEVSCRYAGDVVKGLSEISMNRLSCWRPEVRMLCLRVW